LQDASAQYWWVGVRREQVHVGPIEALVDVVVVVVVVFVCYKPLKQ
jgi:hypothetical protein